jgi:hypothetical protein
MQGIQDGSNNDQNMIWRGGNMGTDNTFYQKRFKIKELVVNLFSFLKIMIPGQFVPPAI